MNAPLRDSLVNALGAEHVIELPEGLRAAPGSAAEVAEVIRRAGTLGAAVHPVGAGGRPSRINDPRGDRPRVFVSTERLDQVLQLDEQSLLVHAQAGLTGLDLERILAPRGLSIGDYPPVVLTSSLGGILAVRTPGKSSARHGFFEEAVVGVSAVLADGRTVHTRVAPRRATGPDLARALCGSEGTIGFITSAVLRIHLKPESRLVAAYILPSIDAAVSAVYLALREEAAPSGMRIYDAAEAARHFDGLALQPGHALIVAATAGPTDLAACDRDLITSAVIAEGGTQTDGSLADLWWRRLHAGEPTPGPAPTLQVMATPAKLRPVYHAVLAEAARRGASARAHISRFDPDGAVMFFTIDPATPAEPGSLHLGPATKAESGSLHLGPATKAEPGSLHLGPATKAEPGSLHLGPATKAEPGSLHLGPATKAEPGSLHLGPATKAEPGSLHLGPATKAEPGSLGGDASLVADAERAAETAGGWLLGARAVKLDTYLRALRDAIDPARIMNPGTLA